MQLCRFALGLSLLCALPARPATVLVLQFHNHSQYSDLNWVGESVAETLMQEFAAADQIVLDRATRMKGLKQLSLRPDAEFTKATLIYLGESLDADYLCYGLYDITLAHGDSQLKDSSIQISAHLIDLRKMHDGPDFAEAGKLAELSRLEEHLAWQCLKYLEPGKNLTADQFMSPQKFTRVDAEESYIRGLLSSNKEQQQKWFAQALALDPKFSSPAFELGKLDLERKEYRRAIQWLGHIDASDPRYTEARFKMGLSAYGAGDYALAANYFREVAKTMPLNEVYNNLGAAENQMNQPEAIADFRRALDSDKNDPTYLFNLGEALLKSKDFEAAATQFSAVLAGDPDDSEAQTLLQDARQRQSPPAGQTLPPSRLKNNFDETAFRQLKAMLQSKAIH